MKISPKTKTWIKYIIAIILGGLCFATLQQFIAYFETVKTVVASVVLLITISTIFIFTAKWLGLYNTFTDDKDINKIPAEIEANTRLVCTIILSCAIIIGAVLCGAFLGV